MNEGVFFFDTYAFFELIRGNPKYEKYKTVLAVTTLFNLAELNYGLKKEVSEKTADIYTDKYAPYITQVTVEDVKNAMNLKLKQRNLSTPDAVGYTVAKRLNIRFLSGDEDFRTLPNVEFVKK